MGGVFTETIEAGTHLELTQTTPFAPVGHEKTVNVRTENGRGLRISGLQISLSVSGANVATGKVITSYLGEAIFSYTGTNAGQDVIVATLVNQSQSVTNTWISTSDNLASCGFHGWHFAVAIRSHYSIGGISHRRQPPGRRTNQCPVAIAWRILGRAICRCRSNCDHGCLSAIWVL